MIDLTQTQANIDALTAQAAATENVEDAAVQAIAGLVSHEAADITAAVTAALQADNAADQGSIDAVTAAIAPIAQVYKNSADKLAAAIATVPPTV